MIRFIRPSLPPPRRWLPFLEEAYTARHFSNFGPVHRRFEEALTARYCPPGKRAVLASSATSALTATLLAMDVRGRVVLPSFTFPATLQAVRQAGCEPLVMDVDERTWELGPETVVGQLQGRDVGAIVPVRAFGLCRDLGAWTQVAARYDVPVVIDAAAALGGCLETGEWVGDQGSVEVFSLHATKVFGVGEGGVAFVPEDLVEPFRSAINFGLPAGRSLAPGFNGKLSEFHSAVGLAMLADIDAAVARRNEVAASYRQGLSTFEELVLPSDVGRPPWQTFPILLPPALESDEFVRTAEREGVELRAYYQPALHTLPGPEGSDAGVDCPRSSYLSQHVVCLPVYSDMSDDEIDAVVRRTSACLTG